MVARAARGSALQGLLRRFLTGASAGVLTTLSLIVAADAQSLRPPDGSAERSAATVSLNIPAQPLDAALSAFARVTGIQLLYDSAVTAGLRSAPVRGTFTPADALARMLASTGLTPRFTGPRSATLQRRPLVQAPAQASTGAPGGGATVLDPIVVQGEKVARDYFRTYTSIGVVGSQDLRDYNIYDVRQSFNLLANVRAFPAEAGNNGFVIRGLNSEGVTQPTNSAPIISVTIDGAIQNTEATRRGSRGTWDVEQIEVLRGPQSTLQGRNSLGGAVLIKTKDPTFTPEVIMEGQAGSQDLRSAAVAVSGPLIPNEVAIRIAGQTLRETRNITYSDPSVTKLGRDEFDQIRAKLLVTPSAMPGLKALFTVNRTIDDPAQNTVTGPDFFARRFDATISAFSEFRRTAVNNYIADISYEWVPGLKIQSVTSYAQTDTKIGTPAGSLLDRKEARIGGDFSQDVRFMFDRPESPLSGVLGVFAGRFTTDIDSLIETGAFGFPVTIQDATFHGTTVSVAAYTDLRYRILERWTLIGGGRLLNDRVSRDAVGVGFDFGTFMPVSLDESVSNSNTVFLPKLGLAFDLTADQTIAGTVNKGYRAGFAELVAGTATFNQVAPEFMWAYELAYRSKWLDNRLQLNANVFYYDYKDQQIAVDNPVVLGQSFTQNAGKSHIYGAEIEARVRPVDSLTLFASLGLLKTKFDQAVTSTGNFSGNEFPESPAVTVAAGGIWKHESGFFAGADVSYTDGYFSPRDLSNDPLRRVSGFTLVNARLGYETRHGVLTLFARNLLDKQYLTAIAQGYSEATIGDGRVVGVKGTLRF